MAPRDDRAGVVAVMTIDPGISVQEALRRFPVTLAVFQQFGIHLCCGSELSIAEAATRDGADPGALIEALRLSIPAEPAPDPAPLRIVR